MQGVYLVAAEMTYLGYIASMTSRNAFGADLLATDQHCRRSWSVQVKTNQKRAGFWLLSKHALTLKSDTHIYVFVNLKGNGRPEFYVVPSLIVADSVDEETTKSGTWYSFGYARAKPYLEAWKAGFGEPAPIA